MIIGFFLFSLISLLLFLYDPFKFLFQFIPAHGNDGWPPMWAGIWIVQVQQLINQTFPPPHRTDRLLPFTAALQDMVATLSWIISADSCRCILRQAVDHLHQKFLLAIHGKQVVRHCPHRVFPAAERLDLKTNAPGNISMYVFKRTLLRCIPSVRMIGGFSMLGSKFLLSSVSAWSSHTAPSHGLHADR